jgi:ATP-dependent Zn protease
MRLVLPTFVASSFFAVVLFAQEVQPERESRLWTAFITWLPFLVLVALWWFFMRKLGGKKGYAANIEASQQRLESIDASLKRIASSLERLENQREHPLPPNAPN